MCYISISINSKQNFKLKCVIMVKENLIFKVITENDFYKSQKLTLHILFYFYVDIWIAVGLETIHNTLLLKPCLISYSYVPVKMYIASFSLVLLCYYASYDLLLQILAFMLQVYIKKIVSNYLYSKTWLYLDI